MNPILAQLQLYPFERIAKLNNGISAPKNKATIVMSIGEPRHAAPKFIGEELAVNLQGLSRYPATQGTSELRTAIANWLTGRFSLKAGSLDPERNVLPVNGTREALFAFAQCVVNAQAAALVLMPNPFYQIYEGAALLAGAKPWYINVSDNSRLLPEDRKSTRLNSSHRL